MLCVLERGAGAAAGALAAALCFPPHPTGSAPTWSYPSVTRSSMKPEAPPPRPPRQGDCRAGSWRAPHSACTGLCVDICEHGPVQLGTHHAHLTCTPARPAACSGRGTCWCLRCSPHALGDLGLQSGWSWRGRARPHPPRTSRCAGPTEQTAHPGRATPLRRRSLMAVFTVKVSGGVNHFRRLHGPATREPASGGSCSPEKRRRLRDGLVSRAPRPSAFPSSPTLRPLWAPPTCF